MNNEESRNDDKKCEIMEFSSDESDAELEESMVFRHFKAARTMRKTLICPDTAEGSSYIQSLPTEIVFSILGYLDIKSLMTVLKSVSRYFFSILSSKEYWEMRLSQCLSSNSASLKLSECEVERLAKVGLPKCVYELETAKGLSSSKNLVKYSSSSHFGDVHCCKMLSLPGKKLAMSGSRDKTICVYDLSLLGTDTSCLINTNTDHNGWIWALDQEDGRNSKIASGSWDSHINIYDICKGNLQKVTNLNIHSATLCLRFEHNFLIYGTYSKKVFGCDTRSGEIVMTLKNHTKPVLSVASSPNFIWSSGEDKALTCYDRRMNKLLKRIRLASMSSSITYSDPYVWVGAYDGFVKCFSQEMGVVSKFDTGHTQPIISMSHGLGATVVGGKDGKVTVHSPNLSPGLWNTFKLDNSASCVDYKDGVLMAGCCDSTVTFWKNKHLE